MDDLITYLCNYSFEHNIGFVLDGENMKPNEVPSSIGILRLVIINMRWYNKNEIPFQFAHEISHILNGDMGDNKYSTAPIHTKEESLANKRGIDILVDYCELNDIEFDSRKQFFDAFGIPEYLL